MTPDPQAPSLQALLDDWLPPADAALDAFAALDLAAFVVASAALPIPPHERLRRLGVFLECARLLPTLYGAAAWPVLDRAYREALHLCPSDGDTRCSRAAAALACADDAEHDEALLDEARRLAHEAIEAAPQDAHAWTVLGQVAYASERTGALREALAAFEHAVALDPTSGWARLYVAHALHDLEHWAEAAEAYARVPADALPPPHTWRLVLAREQRAWCLLQAGDRAASLQAFGEVLDGWEAALAGDRSEDAEFLDVPELLFEAADGPLAPELGVRAAALLAAFEHEP